MKLWISKTEKVFLLTNQLVEKTKLHPFNQNNKIQFGPEYHYIFMIILILKISDTQYNVTVKNAWKIHEVSREKWYLLVARSSAEKEKWMKAFTNERKRVKEDQENSEFLCKTLYLYEYKF